MPQLKEHTSIDSGVFQSRRGALGPLALAALSGVLLFLAFPLASQPWLAWIALVPFFWSVVESRSLIVALAAGELAGVVFFAGGCPWIRSTIQRYGGLSPGSAALVFGLFLVLMGLYFGLFGWAVNWLARRSARGLFAAPFLWVAIELLRTYTPLGGFPWNLLGYSQVNRPVLMGITPFVGIYGASFVIATVNALITVSLRAVLVRPQPSPTAVANTADLVRLSGRGNRVVVYSELAVAAVLIVVCTLPVQPSSSLGRPVLAAVLVQPNTSMDEQWTTASFGSLLSKLRDLSQDGLAHRTTVGVDRAPTLVIWPEQPAPLYYDQQPELRQLVGDFASTAHASVLLGEIAFARSSSSPPNQDQPLNSALLVNPDRAATQRYDKLHLVPFGEYVPLPHWITSVAGIGKLVRQVGDFVPGTHAVLLDLGGSHFAAAICYESIFPDMVRRSVADGAQWLVNISDDGWYGQSSAAWQSLAMTRVRAIENHRWLLRDTNDGVTAVIAPNGGVVAQLPRNQAAVLTAGFSAEKDTTFYTRHGDGFAYACAIITGGILIAAGVRRRVA